ncbi:hypothetical protein [Abyssalbus ytuae]|uniref:Uncharacterized protein n=1 Tax=Abyssalbus ytuae TaxID=2926907 RepID=A0A9E6ZL16_9FLAO|nr:hypothetical protein [Abyssalbus ytuae]UOB17717.1 hypothetical protein MQE35_00115 [Abyssalbus ytuae]
MKKLISLKKVKQLDKGQQKSIKGGKAPLCDPPEIACYFPATHTWECVLEQYCMN